MNKSPFSTPRGRGQNQHSKPYYRKQRGHWNNKNNNSSNQEEINLNTSGSSDDYIPLNNSLPSPSLTSPSSTVSTSSPFYHIQKQGGQFYNHRHSLGHNESPSHTPARARASFNKSFSPKFNSRPRGKNYNQYQGNNYLGKNKFHGNRETNISIYIDQSFFEDPWAELVNDGEKTTLGPDDSDNLNESSSTEKLDDSSLSQSQEDSLLEEMSFGEDIKTESPK